VIIPYLLAKPYNLASHYPHSLSPFSVGPPPCSASTYTPPPFFSIHTPSPLPLPQTQTRSFDTEAAGSSYATGFIVDAQRGIILTNRHVVTPGPIIAEAVFQNREEVPVKPIYYDPIHDFGFLHFNPSSIKFLQLSEIPLAPHAATVGLDIRVIGNDSGEKISILSGTLARLDRDAPHYSRNGYNDFNTFYLQAASGTKGGSSGSPVIDVQGRAVGLNAGGKNKAASAYYLPLHRVVRALEIVKNHWNKRINKIADTFAIGGSNCRSAENVLDDGTRGGSDMYNIYPLGKDWSSQCIPRGDLQATFVFKGFDEVCRLGLRRETEAEARKVGLDTLPPGGSPGMLVVHSVVPLGPVDGMLEAGDVLVSVNGRIIVDFLTLETLLDNSIDHGITVGVKKEGGGEERGAADGTADGNGDITTTTTTTSSSSPTITIGVERGGKPLTITTIITNVHSITPATLFEFGGGSLHSLSYQQARNKRATVGQVYCADPGYMLGKAGVTAGAIITSVNGRCTPTLQDFTAVVCSLAHGCRVPLQFFTFKDRHCVRNVILDMNWVWYGGPKMWRRNDATGVWDCEKIKVKETVVGEKVAVGEDTVLTEEVGLAKLTQTQEEEKGGIALDTTTTTTTIGADNGWRRELEHKMRCCMVTLKVEIPLIALVDGVHSRAFSGCGIVVHQSNTLGLVLVDRNTVAVAPGDVTLSFGAFPAEVPGRVRFLHPLHNFSLVSYDPRALPSAARSLVRCAHLAPELSALLHRGDDVELLCLTKAQRLIHRTSPVGDPTVPVSVSLPDVPRFRATQLEVIGLVQDFGAACAGALTNKQGDILALWSSVSEQRDGKEKEWAAGLPAVLFTPWVEVVIKRLEAAGGAGAAVEPPQVPVLDAELVPLPLAKAAQYGLPQEWVARLVEFDPERRQVLRVKRTLANSHAADVLKSGDMVLAVDGRPVSGYLDVQKAIWRACGIYNTTSDGTGVGDKDKTPPPVSCGGKKKRNADDDTSPGSHHHEDEDSPPLKKKPSPPELMVDGGGTSTAGTAITTIRTAANTSPSSSPHHHHHPLHRESLKLTIFRDGCIHDNIAINLGWEDGLGTIRLLHWCGAQLQTAHRAVRDLGPPPPGIGPNSVAVTRWHHGSPAHRYGLYALYWIAEVNGEPVHDIDEFLKAVGELPNGADVYVKMLHFESGKSKVLSLKTDTRYWPTWELRLDLTTGEWKREEK